MAGTLNFHSLNVSLPRIHLLHCSDAEAAAVRSHLPDARPGDLPCDFAIVGSLRPENFAESLGDTPAVLLGEELLLGELRLLPRIVDRELRLRRAEEGLAACTADSLEEQERRLASLGGLAASVAHEFNNVLMSILPFVEILKRRISADDVRSDMAIKHIQDAIRRGAQLSKQILRFSRPPALTISEIDARRWLSEFSRNAVSLLGPRYYVRTQIPPDQLFLRGDSSLLEQVTTNLLLNARDAMPEGGDIMLSLRAAGEETIEIEIRDQGCGIAEEVRGRIFDPLFTTKRDAAGLGLTIVHQAMRRQEGTIRFESSVGEGSAFTVSFPRALSPAPLPRGEKRSKGDERLRRKKRVLLVDDEEAVGAGIRALLEDEGFDVHLITRGGGAVAAMEAFSPDVVVLDVNLPDKKGTEVFEELRARRSDLAVIFSTGHADAEVLDDVRRYGLTTVRKPYNIEELVGAIWWP